MTTPMLNRRSILRGMLSGAVAAVARVSPLVAAVKPTVAAEPGYHTTFRWDDAPPASHKDIVRCMEVALRRLKRVEHFGQAVVYVPKAVRDGQVAEWGQRHGILVRKYPPLP